MADPDPLAPLRHIADTSDLATAATNDLEQRAQLLTSTLNNLPAAHHNLRLARQAVLVELHAQRGRSFGDLGAILKVTRGRAKQIVDGLIESGTKRVGGEGPTAVTTSFETDRVPVDGGYVIADLRALAARLKIPNRTGMVKSELIGTINATLDAEPEGAS